MQIKKKQRPQNAKAMSKTALIAEVRKLRRDAREGEKRRQALRDRVRELENEIARRDNASAMFRDIEPRALYIAVRVYSLWEADGFKPIDYGTHSLASDAIDKELGNRYNEFWGVIAFNMVADYLETIRKAREDD